MGKIKNIFWCQQGNFRACINENKNGTFDKVDIHVFTILAVKKNRFLDFITAFVSYFRSFWRLFSKLKNLLFSVFSALKCENDPNN